MDKKIAHPIPMGKAIAIAIKDIYIVANIIGRMEKLKVLEGEMGLHVFPRIKSNRDTSLKKARLSREIKKIINANMIMLKIAIIFTELKNIFSISCFILPLP